MKVGPELAVALDCRNDLGESIIWDHREQRLWWVNIHDRQIWKWSPFSADDPEIFILDERVGAIALREKGGIAVALESGFAMFDAANGRLDRIVDVETDQPTTRLNDGRADPAGRFVCGGMDEANPQRHISAVYSLDRDRNLARLIDGVACSNSICWSPDDRTLYFTDMPNRRIDAFDYDVTTGTASNRRTFADLSAESGFADGSTVDSEGGVWNAQWGGSKVVRYTADGTVDREIFLPVTNPTCISFGGPDLDVLFISTARFGLDEWTLANEPHAGSIFAVKPGFRGLPEHRFAG
jgi:L-arabinonolactonase